VAVNDKAPSWGQRFINDGGPGPTYIFLKWLGQSLHRVNQSSAHKLAAGPGLRMKMDKDVFPFKDALEH
jgi:hypothetical protein